MTFEECVITCLHNKELMQVFNRIHKTNLGENGEFANIKPEDVQNFDPKDESITAFVAFVFEFVWTPLLSKAQPVAEEETVAEGK